jgi:hypothetical protein
MGETMETTMSSIAMSDSPSLPSVSRHQFVVEHVRIDSQKPYLETRAALETLPRFDERIRAHLLHGDIERVKAELKSIQGDAGLVIFSIATHGDWLDSFGKAPCCAVCHRQRARIDANDTT